MEVFYRSVCKDAFVFAVFLYCGSDYLSCPVSAIIQMLQITWAVWAAIKKYSLIIMNLVLNLAYDNNLEINGVRGVEGFCSP